MVPPLRIKILRLAPWLDNFLAAATEALQQPALSTSQPPRPGLPPGVWPPSPLPEARSQYFKTCPSPILPLSTPHVHSGGASPQVSSKLVDAGHVQLVLDDAEVPLTTAGRGGQHHSPQVASPQAFGTQMPLLDSSVSFLEKATYRAQRRGVPEPGFANGLPHPSVCVTLGQSVTRSFFFSGYPF